MTASRARSVLGRTAREYGFLISPLALAPVWFAALITVWTVAVCVAITPLVVPALVAVALTVRAAAIAESRLCGGLLRMEVQLPTWEWGTGFWRRAWGVLTDPWLWRAQAYLLLRLTVGFGVALVLVLLLAAGLLLLALPAIDWSTPEAVDLGAYGVHTPAEALPAIPAGVLVLALTAGVARQLTRPWRRISVTLLNEMQMAAAWFCMCTHGFHCCLRLCFKC